MQRLVSRWNQYPSPTTARLVWRSVEPPAKARVIVRECPVRAVQSSPLSSVMNIKCFRPSVGLAVPMSQCAQNVRQMLPCRQFHCDFSCDFRSCQVPIAAQRMLHILGSNSKRIKSVRKTLCTAVQHCEMDCSSRLQAAGQQKMI